MVLKVKLNCSVSDCDPNIKNMGGISILSNTEHLTKESTGD
jgi:hypothetical protein